MSTNVTVTKSLSKIYHEGAIPITALAGVDLAIRQGEFVSIVGPSGSGKSTLLHLIGGLDRPSSGQVSVDGIALDELSERQLSDIRLEKMGFVFQAFNLLPVLSASENVEFILQLQGIDKVERRKRAAEALEGLGLADLHDRRPGEMSGGQQQRVAIARAIVSDPVLLLADEPSANLDSNTTKELCELLRQINQEKGMTILTATHDPLVMGFAHRNIKLQDGRIDDQPT